MTTVIYAVTRDRISSYVAFSALPLFAIGGFMLGLFFEQFAGVNRRRFARWAFVLACSFSGALVVAPMGALASKFLTAECLRMARLGVPESPACLNFVGNAVLVSGAMILAFSVSLGCYRRQMLGRSGNWRKPALTATIVAAWIAGGELVMLDSFDIGGRFFDIKKFPNPVNEHSVLVGGAILGAALGLLVGAHAALMIAFAPEPVANAVGSSELALEDPLRPPGIEQHYDVFISYARADLPTAEEISQSLRDHGISAYQDVVNIPGGVSWRREIVAAIENCRVVLVVLSVNSAKSEQVPKEIDVAERAHKPLLPVAREPVELRGELSFALGRLHIVEFYGSDSKTRLERLLGALAAHGVHRK